MAYWSQNDFSGGLDERSFFSPNTLSVFENGYLSNSGTIVKRGAKGLHGTLTAASAVAPLADHLIKGPNDTYFLYINVNSGVVSAIRTTTMTEVDLSTGLKWWNGSSWTTFSLSQNLLTQYVTLGDEVIVNSSGGHLWRWYGGNKQTYSTGTVSGSSGSPTLTGSSTVWSGNVEAGMYFCTADSDPKVYRITSVNSNTSITLDRNLSAALAGASYSIQPIAPVTTSNTSLRHTSASLTNVLAAGVCAVGFKDSRIFYPDYSDESKVRWTGTKVDVASDSSYVGVQVSESDAFFSLSPQIIGSEIRALVADGNLMTAFGPRGATAIKGSVSTDGTDLGASEVVVSKSVSLQSPEYVCETPVGTFISALSGLYLFKDGELTPFGRDRILDLSSQGRMSYVEYPTPRLLYFSSPSAYYGTYSCYEYDFARNVWGMQGFETRMGPPLEFVTKSLGLEDSGKVVDWYYDRSPHSNTLDPGSTEQPLLQIVSQRVPLNPDVGKPGRIKSCFVSGDVDTASEVFANVVGAGSDGSGGNDSEYSSSFAVKGYQRFPVSDNATGPFGDVTFYQDTPDDAALDDTYIYSIGFEFYPTNEL